MPDFSFFDILIFFLVFFLIFRKLFQMSGPKSDKMGSSRTQGIQDITDHFIKNIIDQATPVSEKTRDNDELEGPVYKEELELPQPYWKDPESAFEEGKPEFHNIATPPIPENNKDFQFHEATLFDQKVFQTSDKPVEQKKDILGNDWMTPTNLQKAFILKEILDPPISKRNHH